MLQRCTNGILTPLTTPASEDLPLYLPRGVTGGSEDCPGGYAAQLPLRQLEGLQVDVVVTTRVCPCRAGIVTGDPV